MKEERQELRRTGIDRTLLAGILVLQVAILASLLWLLPRDRRCCLHPGIAEKHGENAGVIADAAGERTRLSMNGSAAPDDPARDDFSQSLVFSSRQALQHAHDIQASIDDAFRETFREFARLNDSLARDAHWDILFPLPSIDMSEHPDSYVIVASLPGIDLDDMRVVLGGRILTLTALQQVGEDPRYGTRDFRRTFRFPGPVLNDESAAAWVSNGVLRVVVPKASIPDPPQKAMRLL